MQRILSRAAHGAVKPHRHYFSSKVGFIGLGNMGLPMAKNLLKAGHSVTVFDLNPAAVDAAVSLGASSASSPADLPPSHSTIITMLPSSPHVDAVFNDPTTGLLSTLPAASSTLFIDASTIDVAVSRRLADQITAVAPAARLIDAPVSGGVTGAAAGTLTFMCGGTEEAYAQAEGLLGAMGKPVRCGDGGCGLVVKICNNLVLGISMIGVAEAMNLGMQLGMDAKAMAEVFNRSSAQCWSSEKYNPVPGVVEGVPAGNNYEGGFGAELMAKDLGLAIEAAHAVKASLPMGGGAQQFYNLMCAQGLGKKDFGVVYEYLAKNEFNKKK